MPTSQEIKSKISILQYLADKGIKVRYRRIFRCPTGSHDDEHPSCVVYDNPKGEYIKCFACNLSGDIFNLVGELEGLPTYKEQYYFLIRKYGLGRSK